MLPYLKYPSSPPKFNIKYRDSKVKLVKIIILAILIPFLLGKNEWTYQKYSISNQRIGAKIGAHGKEIGGHKAGKDT